MHLIKKHTLDIECTSEPFGKEVHSVIGDIMAKELYPELEQLLNRYSVTDFTQVIDQITIQLPTLSKKNWKTEFVRHTLVQIEEYLKSNSYFLNEKKSFKPENENNIISDKSFSSNKNRYPPEKNSSTHINNNPVINSNSNNDSHTYVSNSDYTGSLFIEYLIEGILNENSLYTNLQQLITAIEQQSKEASSTTMLLFIEKLFRVFIENPTSLIRYIFNIPEKVKKIIQDKVPDFPSEAQNLILQVLATLKITPGSGTTLKLWTDFFIWRYYFYTTNRETKYAVTILKDFSSKYFYWNEKQLVNTLNHLKSHIKTDKANLQSLKELLDLCHSILIQNTHNNQDEMSSNNKKTIPQSELENNLANLEMNSPQQTTEDIANNKLIGEATDMENTKNTKDNKAIENIHDNNDPLKDGNSEIIPETANQKNNIPKNSNDNKDNGNTIGEVPDNNDSKNIGSNDAIQDSTNQKSKTSHDAKNIEDNKDEDEDAINIREINPKVIGKQERTGSENYDALTSNSKNTQLKKILAAANTATANISPQYQATKTETVYIENAGLVILHPFLTTLFEQTGLYKNQKWTSDKNRQKAVLLTQYLITGKTNITENELLLNKFLCGFPIQEVLYTKIKITKKDKDLCHDLLLAVIQYWSILKDTSPQALRETFLIRKAKMVINKDNTAELWVEQLAVDILLAKLPWGISMVKTPWMEDFLQCNWN